MNIILKSFDGEYCKEILEGALKGLEIGTCISIADHTRQLPEIETKEHIWLPAGPLRAGEYPEETDWNAMRPVDAELIDAMRHTEAVFLAMIERYAVTKDMPYRERKRQYLMHLRYWNHMLEEKQIDLLLLNHQPHQCYDYVLYNLCKLKNIPTLHIERCYIIDAFFLPSDWEESAKELQAEIEKISKEHASKDIPLSPKYEHYFDAQTKTNETPWYMNMRKGNAKKKTFLSKWGKVAVQALVKKPKYMLGVLRDPGVWTRKWKQHRIAQMYDQLIEPKPDLDKPYVYVPLHFQPEASTCPMAGVFTHQLLMVQMLAACLPKDIAIYVKEHPNQGEMCRTAEFYETLAKTDGVTLVPKTLSTFDLSENSIAVATATGTAAFEALFREKPVLMFGHRFFQYATGVYPIHTTEDLNVALDEILKNGKAPTTNDMRVFLKAVEHCAGKTYVGPPNSEQEPYTKDEQAKYMGEFISQKIKAVLRR